METNARVLQATAAMAQARKAAQARKEREELINKYPFLTPVEDESYDNPNWRAAWANNKKTLTKNIKALLKHEFPNIKFSVKRNNFSGGFDYSIEYNTAFLGEDWEAIENLRAQVKKVVGNFTRPHKYDIDDSFDSWDSAFTKTFGGMPYICNIYDYRK